MTQIDLFPELTPETPSLHLAIRASPFHKPGQGEERAIHATSIRTSLKSLHTKDPLGSFSKMFMGIFPLASMKYSMIWQIKTTPQGRSYFQAARLSVPRTTEKGSGSSQEMWATPRTTDASGGARPMDERGRRISHSSNLVFGANLSDQVRMWPTPRASSAMNDSTQSVQKRLNKRGYEVKLEQAVRMWPTPTTRDHKGGYQGGRIRNGKVSMDTLDVAVQHTDNQQKTGGQLNPQWVEWLMGYPEGWTDLKG